MQTVKPRMDCVRYGGPAGMAWWLRKPLCFYTARADLAKQRRQLAEMPQWQLRVLGLILFRKVEAENHHGALAALEKGAMEKDASASRVATKAEAGQTGLAIIRAALNSSFAKDAPHKAICGDDGLKFLTGLVQGRLS